jgi:small-conductance mechanosensitive channel
MLEQALGLLDSIYSPIVGQTYADFITAGIIIISFFIIAKIINFILKRFIERLTAKTESKLDDLIVEAISLPIIVGIVLLGVFIALQGLPELATYADLINSAYTVFYILFGALIAIRIINAFVQWYALEVAHKTKSKVDEQFLPMIKRVISGVVLLIALVWILGAFGVEITALVATLGVGGIAIALALQDTLKEFFSGAHVILDKPIRIGDFIELESGDKGTVTDIGWRSTTIKTFARNYVIIPNSKLASSKLINYDQPKQELGFSVDVGVGYNENLEKVEKVAIDVAKKILKSQGTGAKDFEPFARFQEFGDSNINFKVIFRVNSYPDQFAIKHEFIKAIKKRFDKEGIEISWPVRKVYTHKGKGK